MALGKSDFERWTLRNPWGKIFLSLREVVHAIREHTGFLATDGCFLRTLQQELTVRLSPTPFQ